MENDVVTLPGGLQVCEIFELSPEQLVPAPKRELLAAVLGDLRDSHWSRAVGCSPSPGLMTPINLDLALGIGQQQAGGLHYHSARRALAAAEKRLCLLPDDRWVSGVLVCWHAAVGI